MEPFSFCLFFFFFTSLPPPSILEAGPFGSVCRMWGRMCAGPAWFTSGIACSLFCLKLSSMVKIPPRTIRPWHPQNRSTSTVAGSVRPSPVRKERLKSTTPSTAAGSSASVHEILGSVTEGVTAHRRRHQNFDKHYARCTWYKFESTWKHTCGSIRKRDQGSEQFPCWVQERPAHLGGTWALGCVVCSQAAQLLGEQGSTKQFRQWSTYQFRGPLLAARLSEHAQTKIHRRALQLWQDPGSVAGSQ